MKDGVMKTKFEGSNVYNLTTVDKSPSLIRSIDNSLFYEHKCTASYNIKKVLRTEIITIK